MKSLTRFRVLTKHTIQHASRPLLDVRLRLTYGCPQLVFFGKAVFEGKLWEIGVDARAGVSLVASMFTIVFSAVLL